MTKKLKNFIDGKPTESTTQRWGEVYDPSLGAVASHVPMSTTADVKVAVAAARRAFGGWSATPALRRARVLFRFKALLDEHTDELAGLLTAEHGKVLDDARGSVTRGLEVVEFACGIPQLLKGEYSEQVGRGVDCWSFRQPLGVCAGGMAFMHDLQARRDGDITIVAPDVDRETLTAMGKHGVVGVRLNWVRRPSLPDVASADYRRLFATLRELGWHVEIYLEGALLASVLPKIRESGVHVVVDHFGNPDPARSIACASRPDICANSTRSIRDTTDSRTRS